MGADALLCSTQDLVTHGFVYDEAMQTDAHREADRFRADLDDLLSAHRAEIDELVHSQAVTFSERMHEARLEFDLARILGPDDARGQEALGRALSAVQRDGRALLRAIAHFSFVADRPGVHLSIVR